MVLRTSLLIASLAAFGCSASDSETSTKTPPPSSPSASTASDEKWLGYFESFHFDSGSDRIALVVHASGDAVAGAARFGDRPALPPPSNPDVGYPTGERLTAPVAEGFDYSVMRGTRDAQRIKFEVRSDELYKSWCELQTTIYPVKFDGKIVGFGCMPNAASGNDPSSSSCFFQEEGATSTPIDCGKMSLCVPTSSVCECTSTKCTVALDHEPKMPRTLTFDLHVDGNEASGSVVGMGQGAITVRLQRAP